MTHPAQSDAPPNGAARSQATRSLAILVRAPAAGAMAGGSEESCQSRGHKHGGRLGTVDLALALSGFGNLLLAAVGWPFVSLLVLCLSAALWCALAYATLCSRDDVPTAEMMLARWRDPWPRPLRAGLSQRHVRLLIGSLMGMVSAYGTGLAFLTLPRAH